ncbi:MAG TPA: O-antigen ligase family protein [Thermoanaerobaculia bacterium]
MSAIPPPPAPRLALRIVQAGAVAVVLVVTTWNAFELDRFFVPKELALHLTAALAALMAIRAISRLSMTRVDLLLAAYLLLGVLSAAFATNRWIALRALAISASGVLLFWTARALRESGLGRPLLNALALAVVVAAITSLLQTYGVETDFFSESRVPGGTLGNRNFIAHVAAFGFPLLMLAALRAREGRAFLFASIGAAIVTASLVLTRSRAAWLAFSAVLLVFFIAMIVSPPVRRDGKTWRRLAVIVIAAGAGVAAALIVPNALKWRSRNPYLESVQRVADYQQGSGRGRLIQYGHSLLMAVRHPLFGVGPGNWPVDYPAYAARRDPSLSDSEPGMTFNPWPSSDWIAFIAERGFIAAALLALVFLGLAAGALRQLRGAPDVDQALLAVALLGTMAGAIVAGAFDAVLLIAVPAFLVWTALGALWVPAIRSDVEPQHARWIPIVILLSAVGTVRSASQLIGMNVYATRGDRTSLVRAAHIDPGNFRLQLRLARGGRRNERCDHARAARGLYPHAQAAIEVARGCGE